ncbi:MAG: threonine synthase [Rhizobiales bacterium]|nr:threonine synthase [Hyphomicrobiales bacterium]
MRYVSTRGEAPALGFADVLLAGLARDGGLYVPETWPRFSPKVIASWAGKPYAVVAGEVMRPFIGDAIPERELDAILADAHDQFAHALVAPLVQIGPEHWLLELFHGPTMAFKDVAMQVLARLMDRTLAERGQRATIIGATSGDTGGAAIEAFRGCDAIDIFILFPDGRVSDVQRRQMTTPVEANVHAIAIDGTFDDCQNIVKALFNDLAFRDRMALAGVNSINWARILPQVVYYFTSAIALGAPARKVSFSVPTGNFGDIFAGYAAKRMGLAIGQLIIATNTNDILARTAATGDYEPRPVVATSSPSMDIQISSNFERYLFELSGRDAGRVRSLMSEVAKGRGFRLGEADVAALRQDFAGHGIGEDEVARTLAEVHRSTGGMVIDPHTAVGVAAAGREAGRGGPIVTLATAHPAKFPDAIERAIGIRPPEPPRIAAQRTMAERFVRIANDAAAVARHVEERARAVGAGGRSA